MQFETTTVEPVETAGVGLHSGQDVCLRILPASSGSGIVFVRTDLDSFEIPADWRHLARVSYATSLMRKGVLLSTTEHLLSALYAGGIDNARIEIDNLEVPILDGSAHPLVEMLQGAGIKQLRRHRRYLRIVRPVEIVEGDKRIAIGPADEFRITCRTDYGHPLAGPDEVELSVAADDYARLIAPARTFGFEADLETMRDMGLIRGAGLDNAVCFSPDSVLNPGGLRFPDECCRHKLLDLIGDLALLGRPLLANVTVERGGHALHAALVQKIMHDDSCYEEIPWSVAETAIPDAVAG